MRLVFSGHRGGTPPITHVGQLPARGSYGDTNGSFNHNGSYYQDGDVLTVTFNPQIQIVNGLDQATETSVREHELQHHRDFQRLAERLRIALQGAIGRRADPQVDLRWEWFSFDIREAENQFHQRTRQGDIRPNNPPRQPRPQ